MYKRTLKISVFISLVVIGVLIGLIIGTKFDFSNKVNAELSPITVEKAVDSSARVFENSIVNVADTVGKAIVSISVEVTEKLSSGRRFYFNNSPFKDSPFEEDDLSRRFFEEFFGGEAPEREFKQSGLGSGVIVDKKGYILTNEHVVRRADKIIVSLSDGREFKAEIKGTDPRSDLAVIKIDADNLPVASLGDSDNLKIGQWVVAIGNPFGAYINSSEPTVTVGVISALHRTLGVGLRKESDYTDLIQTDAAINPGNSGGPLVNLKGEVVGINTAIFSTSGGYQGIGFSIPVNVVKKVLSRLIEGKKIAYAWLGVTVQNLDGYLARRFGVESGKGALVAKILANCPAQKAGLKVGDVILKFEDNKISNIQELIGSVSKTEVGRKVKLELIRDKKHMEVKVSLDERPKNLDEEVLESEPDKEASYSWRGLNVGAITEEVSKYYKLSDSKGVVVVGVKDSSLAEEIGLSKGDIIDSIENREIADLSSFKKITSSIKKDKEVLLHTSKGYFILKGE